MNKWFETNVYLTKDEDTPTFKKAIIELKPFVKELYELKLENFSWHFFREPHICLRFYASEVDIDKLVKVKLEKKLIELEKEEPEVFKGHEFRPQYNGEVEYYGKDAWEAQYKLWEAGANLSLVNVESKEHPNVFHSVRAMHLINNQLGMTRFQEGLLHYNQAVAFIGETGLYDDLIVKLRIIFLELMSGIRPMGSNI